MAMHLNCVILEGFSNMKAFQAATGFLEVNDIGVIMSSSRRYRVQWPTDIRIVSIFNCRDIEFMLSRLLGNSKENGG